MITEQHLRNRSSLLKLLRRLPLRHRNNAFAVSSFPGDPVNRWSNRLLAPFPSGYWKRHDRKGTDLVCSENNDVPSPVNRTDAMCPNVISVKERHTQQTRRLRAGPSETPDLGYHRVPHSRKLAAVTPRARWIHRLLCRFVQIHQVPKLESQVRLGQGTRRKVFWGGVGGLNSGLSRPSSCSRTTLAAVSHALL